MLAYRQSGLTVRIESDISMTVFRLNIFDHFLTNNTDADILYRFHSIPSDTMTLPPPDEIEMDEVLNCSLLFYHSPFLQSPVVRSCLRQGYGRPEQVQFVIRPYSVMIYDYENRREDIFFTEEAARRYSRVKVEPALYGSFFPTFSKLMIHAAGIRRGDVAALFLAPDGGGKTTIARLVPPQTVLSDDHVLLHRDRGIITASGTPWGLITNNIENVPLGGLFLIEHGERFELIPAAPQEMLEYLWVEHRGAFFGLIKRYKTWIFSFLSEICFSLPVYRIRFAQDYIDWDKIDAAMESTK
jgi:hypothetical protein